MPVLRQAAVAHPGKPKTRLITDRMLDARAEPGFQRFVSRCSGVVARRCVKSRAWGAHTQHSGLPRALGLPAQRSAGAPGSKAGSARSSVVMVSSGADTRREWDAALSGVGASPITCWCSAAPGDEPPRRSLWKRCRNEHPDPDQSPIPQPALLLGQLRGTSDAQSARHSGTVLAVLTLSAGPSSLIE
jgi:hypothetical protein